MGYWTGIGRDGIHWGGNISQDSAPVSQKDLTTKAYVDEYAIQEVAILPITAREGKVVYLKPLKRLYLNIST